MRSILDLVLPNRCAGCDTPATNWCAGCAGSLKVRPVPRPGLGAAYALSGYEGAARRAVLAYKERGRHELSVPFGRAFARALPTVRAGPYVVVPTPSRPAAARARYGQHMTAVARACASALVHAGHRATVAPVLRLSGRARDSVGLDQDARVANLRGRLWCTGPAPRAAVLLDDVITTGATAAACVAALRRRGSEEVTVLAFTAT
ncbi:ComF family protein [Actinophytocola sp. NPDC049390]|uniref:ComF family protein n=1 Tax=Actinophytocola sp. NPDC049390 TaxID=3363894 RepID=UPI0037B4C58D